MPTSKSTSKPNELMPAGPGPHPSGYRMFTEAQLDEIHLAALEILRRTGVRVYEAESVALLKEASCLVTDENRVRFPAAVIENALLYAPSRITVCDRTGQPAMHLEGHRTYFGTGSDLPNVLDLETGERRLAVLADVQQTARLADSLPNLDFVMSMALPSDVPVETSDRHSFLAMLENTVKPLVFTAWDEVGLADLIAMAEIVAGGPGELELKPFLLAYLEPVSPLQHSEVVLRKVLMMADHGLPFVYAPGPIEGASAPVTPAGSLAMAAAEVLSGLAITQLRRRGAPFVWGSGSGPLDMRTLVGTYASPEFMLHCMGMAELAHYYYHLPVWGFSGCSDSKLPDIQAGIESALWILWTALSGANLVHDIGYVESGLTCSYEMIIICDEIISFVRRLMRGIELSPETLALDVMDQVGPGGEYIKAKHTAAHYREVWYPRLFDRRNYHAWREAGQPDAVKTARDMARQAVMAAPANPLPDDIVESLRVVIAAADARAGITP
ncbi:MAG: trimethylamine methyltransferase family protein [Anaerolineales bacterium]|nr:trimethylamine methyltransferase family protein [Anaerolineales bacterium]